PGTRVRSERPEREKLQRIASRGGLAGVFDWCCPLTSIRQAFATLSARGYRRHARENIEREGKATDREEELLPNIEAVRETAEPPHRAIGQGPTHIPLGVTHGP